MKNNGAPETATALASTDADAARAELAQVLGSSGFRASARIKHFLRYIVAETLEGRASRIKAYTIATDVFGRGPDFDPGTDPIVRIEAGRLRRALERYYLAEGAGDPVVIEVPKGNYVPTFRPADKTESSSTVGGAQRPTDASVAIVPLQDLGGNADQQFFTAGLTEEMGVALGQYPDVRVVPAPNLSADSNVRELGKALDVMFALCGSVRRAGSKVRVTVRLVETRGGAQIWAQTYDRELTTANLFAVQDQIALSIVVNIAELYGGAMSEALTKQTRDVPTDDLTAYEAILRYHHYNRVTATTAWAETKKALESAVEKDPHYAPALSALAEVTADGWAYGFGEPSDVAADRLLTMTRRAKLLEPGGYQSHFSEACVHVAMRNRDHVVAEADSMLAKDPPAGFQALAGWLLCIAGSFDRGVPIVTAAIREYSGCPPWLHHALLLDHFKNGRYGAALAEGMKFVMPTLVWDSIDRAAVFTRLGRNDEARAEIERVLELQPDFANRPERYVNWFVLDEDLGEDMMAALEDVL